MRKWISRKLGIFTIGSGTIVLLSLLSAFKPVVGWQITIITCTGMLVFAYIDGKRKNEL